MHADIQGALNQINKSYRSFEHRGIPMRKDEVKKVLEFGLKRGYKTTNEFSDEEVDKILCLPKLEAPRVRENEEGGNVCKICGGTGEIESGGMFGTGINYDICPFC